MDTILEFQDDEYPPLADGQVESVDDEQREEADNTTEEDVDEEAFNQVDEGADEEVKSSLGKGTEAKSSLGEGTEAQSSLGEGTAAGLTYEQAKIAAELEEKLETYERARKMMEEIGDRSSALALARTIHAEKRKYRATIQRDPAIGQALNDKLTADAQQYALKRIEYQKERMALADAKKAKDECQELKRLQTVLQTKLRQAKSLLECSTQVKRFSKEMLGDGRAHGGPAKCRDLRFEVLDRVLAHGAPLSAQQKNDWAWFKREWDAAMANEHDKKWGGEFAGIMQHLLNKLEAGEMSAIADFMYNETVRVLSDVPTLSA